MSCMKAPRTSWLFGLFSTEGPHSYIIKSIKIWAFGKWEYNAQCKHCNCGYHRFGISEDDMMRMLGVHPDEWKYKEENND